jgi:hypothetical protein
MAQSLGRQAGQAADYLHAAVHPGDELRGPRDDLPRDMLAALQQSIGALGRAEDALAPGIGQADVARGRDALREVRDHLERYEAYLDDDGFTDRTLRWAIRAALAVARQSP